MVEVVDLPQPDSPTRPTLSPRWTLKLMASNHLPGGVDLPAMSRSLFSEAAYHGIGFGLGFAVTMNPAQTLIAGSPGEYNWGGAATTSFFIDPADIKEIREAAAMGLALGVRMSKATGTQKLATEFYKTCELMAVTRPTAVNLFWAIDRMKRVFAEATGAGQSVDQIKDRLEAEARR